MKSPYHSNSYVDLDGDGNADIIVTTEKHFEIWHNAGQKELNFVHSKSVKLPEKCGDDCKVGQLAFADFDLDGKLDVLFPLCLDSECVESQIYFTTVTVITLIILIIKNVCLSVCLYGTDFSETT